MERRWNALQDAGSLGVERRSFAKKIGNVHAEGSADARHGFGG